MKKVLKRFITVIAVLAITASVCPVSFAAEELTLEMVTGSQPANMITQNLTLPEGYEWSSSDESVLSNTGVINPKVSEDTNVTIKTQDASGNSVSFDLVVKSKMTNVLYSDSFYYPNDVNFETTNNGNPFTSILYFHNRVDSNSGKLKLAGTQALDDKFIVDEETGNQYVQGDFSTKGAQNVYYAFEPGNSTVIVSFDMKVDWADGATTNPLDAFVQLPNKTDATKVVNARLFRLTYNGNICLGASYNFDTKVNVQSGSWVTVTLEINPVLGTVSLLKPDGTWTSAQSYMTQGGSINNGATADSNTIKSIRFHKGSGGSVLGKLNLDDFSVYTTSLANLSDSDKTAYIDSKMELSSITAESAGAITSNVALDTYEGLVSWTSSNENVIKADGTVTQPDGVISAPVTLTASYGEGELAKTASFNVAVSPANTRAVNNKNSAAGKMTEDFESGDISKITMPTDFYMLDMGAKAEYNEASGVYGRGSAVSYPWGVSTSSYLVLDGERIDNEASLALLSDTSLSYAQDADRSGTVAKIVYTGENHTAVGFYPNGWLSKLDPTRYTAGIDFKYTPETEGKGKFAFHVVGNSSNSTVTFDKEAGYMYVSDGNAKKVFELPEGVRENGWVRLDVDVNMAGGAYMVYVNGTAVSDIPFTLANAYVNSSYLNQSLRSLSFTLNNKGTLLIDNVAVKEFTNTDKINVDAALMRAMAHYSNNETLNGTKLPETLYLPGICSSTAVSATLSWDGANVSDGALSGAAERGYYNATLKATSGEESASKEFALLGTPVILDVTDNTVKLLGEAESGILVIAKYTEDAALESVETKTAEEALAGITLDSTENCKFMYWNGLETMVPYVFAK